MLLRVKPRLKYITRKSIEKLVEVKSYRSKDLVNAAPLLRKDLASSKHSFLWAEHPKLISDDFHMQLCEEYPNIRFFEKHVGLPRGTQNEPQKSHDRYYLALNWGPYSTSKVSSNKIGTVRRKSLSQSWRMFISSLESCKYRRAVSEFLGTDKFTLRFAWHMGFSGAEICPHVDSPTKLGTHIFYFNRVSDWDQNWGGQTVMLDGLTKPIGNPEFSDFTYFNEISNIGNSSLIWRNSADSWHGVKALNAPADKFRKIFTIVFDSY